MVLNQSQNNAAQEPSSPAAGSANASPYQPQGMFAEGGFQPPFGRPFMRGGWGGAFRGGMGMGHGFFRPETVPLEGGEPGHRGHHHHHGPPPPPGQGHSFWGAPHPDPPLASMESGGPEASSFNPGAGAANFVDLLANHARGFAGDLAAHFGGMPTEGPMPGEPGFRSGGWRGRGGMRGGGMRGGRGGWRRGGWGGHHGHSEFVHPRMDIYHLDNTYTVTVELPGLEKKNVDISVTDGVLTISGEFPSSTPPADDPFAEYDTMEEEGEEVTMEAAGHVDGQGRYIIHERLSGKFKRSIRLPAWVNLDDIKATMADGVLTLVFEKPEPEGSTSTTRKLAIA